MEDDPREPIRKSFTLSIPKKHLYWLVPLGILVLVGEVLLVRLAFK